MHRRDSKMNHCRTRRSDRRAARSQTAVGLRCFSGGYSWPTLHSGRFNTSSSTSRSRPGSATHQCQHWVRVTRDQRTEHSPFVVDGGNLVQEPQLLPLRISAESRSENRKPTFPLPASSTASDEPCTVKSLQNPTQWLSMARLSIRWWPDIPTRAVILRCSPLRCWASFIQ